MIIRLTLAIGSAALAALVAGCSSSGGSSTTPTASLAAHSGASSKVSLIGPAFTTAVENSPEALGAFVMENLTNDQVWNGGYTSVSRSIVELRAAAAEVLKASPNQTASSARAFTSTWIKISPYYYSGSRPVLVSKTETADTANAITLKYFVAGTDGNYIVTLETNADANTHWTWTYFNTAETSEASPSPASPDAPPSQGTTGDGSGQSVTGSFVATSDSGIKVSMTLDLSAPVAADQAEAGWHAAGGSGQIPCVQDAQSDGVIVGKISFTNETPSYSPELYILFNQIVTGGPSSFGAGYSDGNQCVTDGSDGYEGSAIEPTWTGPSSGWGPAPVAFVLHNYFGPSYPNGNTSLLTPITFAVDSQSNDSYRITSTHGNISQFNGPVLRLDLTGLK